MGSRPNLLIVGAAARDVDARDPRGWRLGGTIAYSSLAAARLGVAVRALVGVDREAAGAAELDVLRSAGVQVRLVPLDRGPVFDNQQTPSGRVQVVHEVSDALPAAALPLDWARTDAVLLGPIAGELGDEWVATLSTNAFVAVTWQGLLRRLVPGHQVELRPAWREGIVARANALLLSAEDVAADAGPIRDLLGPGQHVLLTHGEHGAAELHYDAGQLRGRWIPSLPPRIPADTTGAGDVFVAAWLAARLLVPDAPPDRHLAIASIASSLKVAGHGLGGVPGLAEVCRELLRRRDSPA